MRPRYCLAFAIALACAPVIRSQDYRWEQNDALGVRFQVHKKLFPVPLKLGEADPNERAKFEPKDQGDYIHGRLGTYSWGLYIVDFPKKKEPAKTGGGAETPEEAVARHHPSSTSFQQWVTDGDRTSQDRKFVKKAVPIKGKGKGLDCKWWEYTDTQKVNTGVKGKDEALVWYHCAASFDLPEREVALWCVVPVKRGTEADPTYMKWMETMCQSLQTIEVEAASEADAKRDEFANTPERKAELERAKANIQNLKGWSYFTMPDYIVLHSWDPKKDTPEQRKESLRFAKDLVGKLEEVRELYIKEFPPHDKMKATYPVLRVCDSYEEFQKYGDSPRGVVGWFSPRTKELVVFNDTEHYLGSKDVFTTVRHEGWHQYADSYFNLGERAELHRWYDEGLGDYFGSYNKQGGTWSYTADKGRHTGIRAQLSRKNYVPLREIVAWNKDKFYGERAVDYYAEGYSLVDFLRRGPEVLGKRFDERWTKIMEIYRSTILETHDQKKAVEAAFAGIDWDQFQAAWEDWVRNSMK